MHMHRIAKREVARVRDHHGQHGLAIIHLRFDVPCELDGLSRGLVIAQVGTRVAGAVDARVVEEGRCARSGEICHVSRRQIGATANDRKDGKPGTLRLAEDVTDMSSTDAPSPVTTNVAGASAA
jgi:hypothetical protein